MSVLKQSLQPLGLVSLAMVTLLGTMPALAASERPGPDAASPMGHCQHKSDSEKGAWCKKHREAHQQFMQELNLSEAQKAQMKSAHEKFRQENAAAIDSLKSKYSQLKQMGKDDANSAERQKLRAEIKQEREALMARKKASMQGILTPEQQSKWETKQAERKAQWQQKRKQMQTPAPQSN